jgi:outer membrane protein OmpA-like peptidoglycan-associated protein
MAQRTGKCTNYTKCTTAYRNQPIAVTGDLVCPECGQPLQEITQKSAPPMRMPLIAGGAVALLAIIGLIVFFSNRHTPPPPPATPGTAQVTPSTPEPAPPEPPPAVTPSAPPPSVASTTPAPVVTEPLPPPPPLPEPAPEPAAPVVLEENVNVDPKSAENQQIKQEVLKRIEAMPKLSDTEKDKLYAHVERARGMGRVITIPFSSGQTTLSGQNIAQLKAATQSPQIAKMVSDPAVVFVILGFADTKGQQAANERISTNRAESAMQALRDKCAFLNVMHPVGMGGSELFDAGDHAKNRVVEVWAVLP